MASKTNPYRCPQSKLEERICLLLRRRYHCLCNLRPRSCACVFDLVNLVLEKCEEETSDPDVVSLSVYI